MYVNTFLEIIILKTIDTPFLYAGNLFIKTAKLSFYLSPLLFAGVALYASIKKQRRLLILPLCVALLYFLGIRPTTDYDHLGPLLAISSITFPVMLHLTKNTALKKVLFIIFLGMILFGFYTAYFKGYYKWETPLRDDNIYATDPRLHVFLTSGTLNKSEVLKQYIDRHSKPNEPIFINYYAPFIYFLANRQNASRYDYISPNAIPSAYQRETIQTLQKKHVKLILTLGENEQSLIADYIRKNYPLKERIFDYDIYTK